VIVQGSGSENYLGRRRKRRVGFQDGRSNGFESFRVEVLGGGDNSLIRSETKEGWEKKEKSQ